MHQGVICRVHKNQKNVKRSNHNTPRGQKYHINYVNTFIISFSPHKPKKNYKTLKPKKNYKTCTLHNFSKKVLFMCSSLVSRAASLSPLRVSNLQFDTFSSITSNAGSQILSLRASNVPSVVCRSRFKFQQQILLAGYGRERSILLILCFPWYQLELML